MRKIIFFLALTFGSLTISTTTTPIFAFYVDAGGPYIVGPNETITLFGWVNIPPGALAGASWSVLGEGVGGGNPTIGSSSCEVSYDYLVNTLGKEPGFYSGGVCLEATFEGYYYYLETPPLWIRGDSGKGYADIRIVPEPATVSLLVLGGVALLRNRRFR